MATAHLPLNPEPSQPKEREEHDLPPKSYAEAVALPPDGQREDHALHSQENFEAQAGATVETVEWHQENPDSPTLTNGTQTPAKEDTEIYEKHIDSNGHILTSVKPSKGYEESLKHHEAIAPPRQRSRKTAKIPDTPNSILKTGRVAGAGWGKSA